MQQIQQIERVLGESYGKEPKEVTISWSNCFVDYFKQHNPIRGVLGGLIIASLKKDGCHYRGIDHTIWTRKETTPFSEFAVFHELGHGYTRQRNPKFQEVDDLLVKEGVKSSLGGKFSRKTIEDVFLYRCVDEGIADYLAIQSQKLRVLEKKSKVEDVFCYKREWTLTHCKDPEDGKIFTESTSLNYDIATKLEQMGERLINLFLSVNETTGHIEKIKKSMRVIESFSLYAYVLGHYLVRGTLNNQQEDIGKGINQLIANPPTSIKEIQDRALSVF